MTLVWYIAKTGSGINTVKLILSGIIVSMICSAVISLYIYLFPNQITIIMGTLMGSLNHVFTNLEWYIFLGLVVVSILLLTYLYFLSNSLNIISTGDITAHSLGVDTGKNKKANLCNHFYFDSYCYLLCWYYWLCWLNHTSYS